MTRRVLVVEDDISQRQILQEGLEHFGFEIHMAVNGLEGLKMAEDLKPDVITTDVIMPIMGGVEMIGAIRSTEWGKKIPVIILSNYDNYSDHLKSVINDSSSTYYLVKIDSTLENIVDKINNVCEKHGDQKKSVE